MVGKFQKSMFVFGNPDRLIVKGWGMIVYERKCEYA